MANNTLNPMPSSSPLDFFDNSENLDLGMNSTAETFLDRFGRPRNTYQAFHNLVINAKNDVAPTVAAAKTAVNAARDAGIEGIGESVASVDAAEAAAKLQMEEIAGTLADDLNNKRYTSYSGAGGMLSDPQTRDAVVGIVDGDPDPNLDGWYSWNLSASAWVRFVNQPAQTTMVDGVVTELKVVEADTWSRLKNGRALLSDFDDAGGEAELDSALNLVGGPSVISQLARETEAGLEAYENSPRRALLGDYDDSQKDYVQDSAGTIVDGPVVISALLDIIDSITPSITKSIGRQAVYIDGGVLKTVAAEGEKAFADIAPYAFTGAAQWCDETVISVTDRASLGAKTPVAVSILGGGYACVVPSAEKLLIVIPSYGQSNSVGAQAYTPPAAMTDNQWPENLFMFDLANGTPDVRMNLPAGGAAIGSEEILNGGNLIGFTPLLSVQSTSQSNRGATALEGIGFTVQKMASEHLGFQPDVLMFAAGYGSRPYRDLKKGTIPYANFITALTRAKQLGEQAGYKVYVPFVALVHGEGDSTNLTYAADLVQLQADMQADVLAITGQAGTVPFVCSQASTFFSTEVNGVQDTYSVSKTSGLHSLSAPYYPYEMASDELHLGNRGLYLGEKMARTILRDSKLWGAKGKGALRPTGVAFNGTDTVDIVLDVPFPPLVRDQVNPVVNTPAPANWGFEVQDGSGANVAISSVQIIGNSIRIVTATNPAAGAKRAVRYAMTGYPGTQNGGGVRVKGQQARGQVRDSESTPSVVDGTPLYNWLVHFSENF